jgi:hypothetical protein
MDLRSTARGITLAAALITTTLSVPASDAAAKLSTPATPQPHVVCTGDPGTVRPIVYDASRPDMNGLYAVPRRRPRGLVVFAHGHGHSVLSWANILTRVATNDGYIAVAMEYPGSKLSDPMAPPPNDYEYGWRVREGAAHSIEAAQLFDRTCHGLREIVDYGVSMGGNTSGLMAEAHAKRANGRPLFDHWFDIEGVTNLTEEYLGARALANSGNTTAQTAVQEIQDETGGPIEQVPAAYAALTVVDHAAAIRTSGIRGVVMVHAAADGLVPTDQTQQMAARLAQVGVPADVYEVGTRSPSAQGSDTTLDGYLGLPIQSPFAGHGYEGNPTATVISIGLAHLDAILQGREAWPSGGVHEHFVDGTLGQLF